jgi:hypothetical protein
LPHFSIRAPEGSRSKLAAMIVAIAVAVLARADARAASLNGVEIADVGLTQRIAIDPLSGVAIEGFDPVEFFVSGRAVRGSGLHEAIWNGAVWRFANEGNEAAFLEAPEVYAPRFGGYDATSVAAGIATPANPQFFVIRSGCLFLFRDEPSRSGFVAAPEAARAADAAWPILAGRLIR